MYASVFYSMVREKFFIKVDWREQDAQVYKHRFLYQAKKLKIIQTADVSDKEALLNFNEKAALNRAYENKIKN